MYHIQLIIPIQLCLIIFQLDKEMISFNYSNYKSAVRIYQRKKDRLYSLLSGI